MIVTLWMTTSVNGFIARPNNEEDFISHDSWLAWIEYVKEKGNIIWGRKTYEVVKTWGEDYLKDLQGIIVVVVSSDPIYDIGGGYELVNSPKAALTILKQRGFANAVLTGGSKLNTSFAKLALIDEIVINLEPVLIGAGIPLFDPSQFDLKLALVDSRQTGQLTQLHYSVIK